MVPLGSGLLRIALAALLWCSVAIAQPGLPAQDSLAKAQRLIELRQL